MKLRTRLPLLYLSMILIYCSCSSSTEQEQSETTSEVEIEVQPSVMDTVFIVHHRDRLKLKKNKFSGVIVTTQPNYVVTGEVRDGKNHGKTTTVYEAREEERNFYEGKNHGLWITKRNGVLVERDSFHYGKLQSSYRWDDKGLIQLKDEWRTTGNYENYHTNGQLKIKRTKTRIGSLVEENYAEEGVLLRRIAKGDTVRYPLHFTTNGSLKSSKNVSKSYNPPPVINNNLQKRYGLGYIEGWFAYNGRETVTSKLNFYDAPQGNIIGLMRNQNKEESYNVVYLRDGVQQVNSEDGTDIAIYKTIFYHKFYEEENGYLRVLHHTSPKQALWVKRSEVEQFFKVHNWIEFAATSDRGLVVLNNKSLNVRSGPGTEYKIVGNYKKFARYDGEKFDYLAPTGKVDGRWIEVRAYFGQGCNFNEDEVNEKLKYTGWVKAVDDLGYPNIFREYCGC